MNNIDKINFSFCLIKRASRLGMLASFLKKSKPLFHGINPANQTGLLKHPKAVSALEAINKGLASNVESYVGQARSIADKTMLPIKNINERAVVSYPDMFNLMYKRQGGAAYLGKNLENYNPMHLSQLKYTGPISNAAQSGVLRSAIPDVGAGKNWSTISFKEGRPLKSYGDFGIMTTPERVAAGRLGIVHGPITGEEVIASPKFNINSQGMPTHIELPQAPGKIYYTPSKDNAGLVRQLISRYGRHNLVPMNRSTNSKLKYLDKNLQSYVAPDTLSGDVPYQKILRIDPNYPQHIEDTRKWLSSVVQ